MSKLECLHWEFSRSVCRDYCCFGAFYICEYVKIFYQASWNIKKSALYDYHVLILMIFYFLIFFKNIFSFASYYCFEFHFFSFLFCGPSYMALQLRFISYNWQLTEKVTPI